MVKFEFPTILECSSSADTLLLALHQSVLIVHEKLHLHLHLHRHQSMSPHPLTVQNYKGNIWNDVRGPGGKTLEIGVITWSLRGKTHKQFTNMCTNSFDAACLRINGHI